jgi:hypothetical protein
MTETTPQQNTNFHDNFIKSLHVTIKYIGESLKKRNTDTFNPEEFDKLVGKHYPYLQTMIDNDNKVKIAKTEKIAKKANTSTDDYDKDNEMMERITTVPNKNENGMLKRMVIVRNGRTKELVSTSMCCYKLKKLSKPKKAMYGDEQYCKNKASVETSTGCCCKTHLKHFQ